MVYAAEVFDGILSKNRNQFFSRFYFFVYRLSHSKIFLLTLKPINAYLKV